jgi:hypothetical protein
MDSAILFECICNRFLTQEMSWLPSNYDETYKLVAIIAIIVGALWGVSTWCHQERLRKVKEEPGFECEMEFSQSKLSDGDILLTIDVITMNTGVLPLWPVTRQASISVKAISPPASPGFIKEDTDSKPDAIVYPVADRPDMRLEPGTQTIFSAFFKAKPDQLYAVQFDLPTNYSAKDGEKWRWRKYQVVHVAEKSAKDRS